MPDLQKIKVLRTIAQLENIYPADDMIITYSDFLKCREYLKFHQFNPVLFINLLKLIDSEWNNKSRISRISLLCIGRQYANVAKGKVQGDFYNVDVEKLYDFNKETSVLIFGIFKNVFYGNPVMSETQNYKAKAIANNLLMNVQVGELGEEWLCEKADDNSMILNRILRYPVKSKTISEWVRKNYNNSKYSSRRAELIGWMLDENSNFELDEQTVINDFNTLNETDLNSIQQYENEIAANKMMENELGEFLPRIKKTNFDVDYTDGKVFYDISHPELNLSRRFYKVPNKAQSDFGVSYPDFDALKLHFFSNLELIHKMVMIWGIGYSRLSNKKKSELLQVYYCEETWYSIFKVAKKNKNLPFLKWMVAQ